MSLVEAYLKKIVDEGNSLHNMYGTDIGDVDARLQEIKWLILYAKEHFALEVSPALALGILKSTGNYRDRLTGQ